MDTRNRAELKALRVLVEAVITTLPRDHRQRIAHILGWGCGGEFDAEHVRALQFQIHPPRPRNSIASPLAHRLRPDAKYQRDGGGSAQSIYRD